MASLLKSVGNWFRGKQDEMAKKLSDPVRDGKFAIEDSKKKIAGFTEKIAKLMAETNKLRKSHAEAEKNLEKWQTIAERAAEGGNTDDARTALEKKNLAKQETETLQAEINKNEQITNQLRQQLNRARARVAEAESNSARLVARMEGSKVRKELAKATSEFNSDDNPLAALDDLQKAVDSEEAEAEAWEDITGSGEMSLEEKYTTSSSDVDDELAALMNKNKK